MLEHWSHHHISVTHTRTDWKHYSIDSLFIICISEPKSLFRGGPFDFWGGGGGEGGYSCMCRDKLFFLQFFENKLIFFFSTKANYFFRRIAPTNFLFANTGIRYERLLVKQTIFVPASSKPSIFFSKNWLEANYFVRQKLETNYFFLK